MQLILIALKWHSAPSISRELHHICSHSAMSMIATPCVHANDLDLVLLSVVIRGIRPLPRLVKALALGHLALDEGRASQLVSMTSL